MFAEVLKEYLNVKGSIDTLAIAGDGKKGLKCVESIGITNIDFILLDLCMDEMDGFEFLEKYRELYGKENLDKIQILTSYDEKTISHILRGIGLKNECLKKPIDMMKIVDRLRLLSGMQNSTT